MMNDITKRLEKKGLKILEFSNNVSGQIIIVETPKNIKSEEFANTLGDTFTEGIKNAKYSILSTQKSFLSGALNVYPGKAQVYGLLFDQQDGQVIIDYFNVQSLF